MKLHASALVLCVALFGVSSLNAQLPHQRSTVYTPSFSGALTHSARVYVPLAEMTVEAWVYREDASRCENGLPG